MQDLDAELVDRVARWCAEAGRTTTSAEIGAALSGLGWDELLAVRALLADPPPARPLGPHALADLARGVPAEQAAERERDGRYPATAGDAAPALPPPSSDVPSAPRARGKRTPRSAGPVIRRARDAAPPVPAPSPAAPLADELLLPEGRNVLERLMRRHGAHRHALVVALGAGWRHPDGRAVADEDLDRLLDHHGLARAFASREHDELLHALRAAGGLRAVAAARLGLEREGFDAALARAGATAEAEKIREARRGEVRAKATLAERVRLLLTEPARLEDLGVLAEVEEDVRRRLPEHLRAVSISREPILFALANSLSIAPPEAQALVERLGVTLGGTAGVAGGQPPRARRFDAVPQGAQGGMRPPRRPTGPRAGFGARSDRRGPGTSAGSSGAQRRERPAGGGFGPPRDRRERPAGGGFGPPREKRERTAGGGFGPPREKRERTGGAGFGPPREKRERTGGGFGPPREKRERTGGGGFGPPREKRERTGGGGFGPPREKRERGPGAAGARRPGPRGGMGGARPGKPGPRPGGPGRGRPPPRGPRRG